MKERPILLSGPMIRAILAGRRIMKSYPLPKVYVNQWIKHHNVKCPYGAPGDRLWVRESWRVGAWNCDNNSIAIDYRADSLAKTEWLYLQDSEEFERLWQQSCDDSEKALGYRDEYKWKPGESPCRWRPSIHMPRWASRITLEVTSVRAERLQYISDEDALEEGMKIKGCEFSLDDPCRHCKPCPANKIAQFKSLWDSKGARRPGCSWDDNPWVWVVEFESK